MNFYRTYLVNITAFFTRHEGRRIYDLRYLVYRVMLCVSQFVLVIAPSLRSIPRLILISALWCLVLARPAVAQAPPDAEVDFYIKEKLMQPLTVGDPVKLRLEVTHPSGSQVVLPQLEKEWGAFEVLDQTAAETINHDDGTATTGKDITVTLFQPGRYQTPPLVITHRKLDGTLEELAAPVIPLRVTSVITEASQLQDLKPQVDLLVPPIWPWVAGAALLTVLVMGLIAGAGIWFYHRWQRRAAVPLAPVLVVDTRPPEVIAYIELDRIEALNLPAQNRIKEYYSLVDVCLRRYIEGRYQIPALEQTTGEIRSAFKKSLLPTRYITGFITIFAESDLVKFARYLPEPESVNQLIGKARAVIGATTPMSQETSVTPADAEVRV
jgi:hypothetical protein